MSGASDASGNRRQVVFERWDSETNNPVGAGMASRRPHPGCDIAVITSFTRYFQIENPPEIYLQRSAADGRSHQNGGAAAAAGAVCAEIASHPGPVNARTPGPHAIPRSLPQGAGLFDLKFGHISIRPSAPRRQRGVDSPLPIAVRAALPSEGGLGFFPGLGTTRP